MLTRSQAGQDIFAAYVNQYARDKFYLDLGSNEPFTCNNTASLEIELGWKGILVDFLQHLVDACASQRPNNVSLCANLETKSVEEILTENNAPDTIDYLSLDIDGTTPRLNCLKSIDFEKRLVKCLTFEHDAYLLGPDIMNESRAILEKAGMVRVCSNVLFGGADFEDWYVHKTIADQPHIQQLYSQSKEFSDIVRNCNI